MSAVADTIARNPAVVVQGVPGGADPAGFADIGHPDVVVDTVLRFEASTYNVGDLNEVKATGRRFTFCELHMMRLEDGRLVENWVGGLNPLMFEVWRPPATAPLLFGETT